MTQLSFPEVIDFDKAVALNQNYKCEIAPEFLPRLSASCVKIAAPCRADFTFSLDLQGLRTVSGSLSCDVVLRCERCGGELPFKIECAFSSTPDESKAKSLQIENKLDLVELNEAGRFELLNFLEDCLLLEIPYAPTHKEDDPQCSRPGSDWSFGEDKAPRAENPFAALEALKGQLKS